VAAMFRAGMPLDQVQKRLDMGNYKDFRQYPNYEATFADNATAYYRQLEKRAKENKHIRKNTGKTLRLFSRPSKVRSCANPDRGKCQPSGVVLVKCSGADSSALLAR